AGINAFAVGLDASRSAIAVTDGCLRLLSRDELQGVVAHEFSHLLNGDARMNVRLLGLVHGILVIGLIGSAILRSFGRSSDGSRRKGNVGGLSAVIFVGVSLYVIGSIGVFFARLIKAAVSRQRELLADAAGVQFTRNPAGLAGALKKIGRLSRGSRLLAPRAEEASHFYFSEGMARFTALMSTHPPLPERIRLLDPQFAGELPEGQLEAVALEDEIPGVAVGRLIRADSRIGLFEYTLQRVLLRHLAAHFGPRRPPGGPQVEVREASSLLLSMLAYAGATDPGEVARAFEAARAELSPGRFQ